MAKTPHFAFRLPVDQAAALREMAKIYGAPNTSTFLREMVGASCSGDTEKIKAFNAKLFKGIGEQLTLKLSASIDEAMLAPSTLPLPAPPSAPIKAKAVKPKPKAKAKARKA
jgi:hypothetical protein